MLPSTPFCTLVIYTSNIPSYTDLKLRRNLTLNGIRQNINNRVEDAELGGLAVCLADFTSAHIVTAKRYDDEAKRHQ